tara:strand:- start:262 stop:1149 length:888 start_codon:yes stop_codon:yes gene_type:complete
MAIVTGRVNWTGGRDKEGHRVYNITWLVNSTTAEGPEKIGGATGLAAIGSQWAYGSDLDAWALCYPTLKIKPVVKREPGEWWEVQQTFSTKPLNRCQDTEIENPLNEPANISGGFVKYTREVTKDRNGEPVESSSHEMFRGGSVEFDDNRPTVSISGNVLVLPLSTFAPMVDTVNDATLWGLAKRKIKLSNVSWERLLYGTCTFYYRLTYEFDIRMEGTGFDRVLIDEGTKVLKPGGNVDDPRDFQVYKDGNGENTRVLLDGAGSALVNSASPFEITVEYYAESNFLTLGIPTTL